MFVNNRKILKKTAAKYISQARRSLPGFGVKPDTLRYHKEITIAFGRNITARPKKEYFALE